MRDSLKKSAWYVISNPPGLFHPSFSQIMLQFDVSNCKRGILGHFLPHPYNYCNSFGILSGPTTPWFFPKVMPRPPNFLSTLWTEKRFTKFRVWPGPAQDFQGSVQRNLTHPPSEFFPIHVSGLEKLYVKSVSHTLELFVHDVELSIRQDENMALHISWSWHCPIDRNLNSVFCVHQSQSGAMKLIFSHTSQINKQSKSVSTIKVCHIHRTVFFPESSLNFLPEISSFHSMAVNFNLFGIPFTTTFTSVMSGLNVCSLSLAPPTYGS